VWPELPRWILPFVEGIYSGVRGAACTGELESYADGSLAAVWTTQPRQAHSQVPSTLEFGIGADTLNQLCLETTAREGHGPKTGQSATE
jgi:hypothetical protein